MSKSRFDKNVAGIGDAHATKRPANVSISIDDDDDPIPPRWVSKVHKGPEKRASFIDLADDDGPVYTRPSPRKRGSTVQAQVIDLTTSDDEGVRAVREQKRNSPRPSTHFSPDSNGDRPGNHIKASPTHPHPLESRNQWLPAANHSIQFPYGSPQLPADSSKFPEFGKDEYQKAGNTSKASSNHEGSQTSFQTINSSSPLVQRLKEQKSKASIPPPCSSNNPSIKRHKASSPTFEDLKVSLEVFFQRMRDDHALSVRWLLHDAKKDAITTGKSQAFTDRVSPWQSMKGINSEKGQKAISGSITETIQILDINKSKIKGKHDSTTHIVGESIKDNHPKVPKYSMVTYSKRNYLAVDDELLRYIPYLEEDTNSTSKTKSGSRKSYLRDISEAFIEDRSLPTREAEWASEIRNYLDSWLEELELGPDFDERSIQRYLIQHEGKSLMKTSRALNALLDSLGGPLPSSLNTRIGTFTDVFKDVFGDQTLLNVVLPETHLRELIQSLRPESDTVPGRLSTFEDLTCLICGVVSCQTHGEYTSDTIFHDEEDEKDLVQWEYNLRALSMKHEHSLRKHIIRLKTQESNENRPLALSSPCSEICYKNWNPGRSKGWIQQEIAINTLKEMLICIRDKDRQSCTISAAMEWPCWQVHAEIMKFEKSGSVLPDSPINRHRTLDRPSWYNNSTKTLNKWEDSQVHIHERREEFAPCAHEGPCRRGCSCHDSNLLCESICACPDDCGRKFTGCTCAANGMSCTTASETCICVMMNRECGPQCGTCGAKERIDPDNKYNDVLFTTGCQNVALQREVHKQTVIGESQLEGVGFGLYLGEPVRKGDYISEYLGEIISYDESERRGRGYDRALSSFLFSLNEDFVIDGARIGNKTRFINHADSVKSGLNLEAKVMLVNGNHRIKFYALRDIEVGEELLFNYGEKFAEKHSLHNKLSTTVKESQKNGVVVGRDALDALDGLDDGLRATRDNMENARGHGGQGRGRGRGTAKKTARTRRESTVETEIEPPPPIPPDDEDDEDYDDDFERSDSTKSKRKTRRPARYNR